jgi:hypothetical protein
MTAKEIRKVIGHIPGAWVRCWRSGEVWAGCHGDSKVRSDRVREALEAAGYRCSMDGRPGSAGEFIINVNGRT